MVGVTISNTRAGATSPPAVQTHALGALGMATVLLCAFLGIVDFFLVNVALPAIGSDLQASSGALQLVVGGYGATYAVLLVFGGRLGDRFGRRRVFLVGMAVFTVLRLACGLAPSASTLVVARVLQGATAALLIPQLLATIQAATSGRRRVRLIGAFSATGGLSMVAGQILGGLIVTADIAGTGWRPIFLIFVPANVLAWLLAWRCLPETRAVNPTPLDLRGTVLLGVTLFALLVPLTEGRTLGWPLWTVLALLAVPLGAALFFVSQRRTERAGGAPLVPPSLVRTRSVRVGLILAVPFFASFGGFMFAFPMAMQRGAGLEPLATGLALAPYAAVFFFVSLLVDRVVDRFGRRVLVLGALTAGVGHAGIGAVAWWAWPDIGVLTLLGPAVVAGAGQASVMTPLFRVVLADVPADLAGAGSGLFTTTQQTAIALGVATLASVFLAATDALGMRGAFALVLICCLALFVVVAGIAARLPDQRRR